MNKLVRNQLKQKHYIKRLKMIKPHYVIKKSPNSGYTPASSWTQLLGKDTIRYKTTSTPCSCIMCHGERYDRKKEYKRFEKENMLDYNSDREQEDSCEYRQGCEQLSSKIKENLA